MRLWREQWEEVPSTAGLFWSVGRVYLLTPPQRCPFEQRLWSFYSPHSQCLAQPTGPVLPLSHAECVNVTPTLSQGSPLELSPQSSSSFSDLKNKTQQGHLRGENTGSESWEKNTFLWFKRM